MGWQWELESQWVYVKYKSWWEWKGRIRQAKGTPINASWLPQVSQGKDRSVRKGREEGQKDGKITASDNCQRIQRSVISSAGSLSLRRSLRGMSRGGAMVYVPLGSVVVDSKWTLRHSSPKCMYRPICLPINHSTIAYVTHYLNQIQFNAAKLKVKRRMTALQHVKDLSTLTFRPFFFLIKGLF